MFRITDHAVSPMKDLFSRAASALPEAHHHAKVQVLEDLRLHVMDALAKDGIDGSPVQVAQGRGGPYLGLFGDEGRRLTDREFGTPEIAPVPTIRKALAAHHEDARYAYGAALRDRLGI